MPSLISDRPSLLDTSAGTVTGLPTDERIQEVWRISHAVAVADATVLVPDVPAGEWHVYVDEADEWTTASFQASAETWPQQ